MGDVEIEKLKRKKLAELKRRMATKAHTPEKETAAEINPWQLVEAKLIDRGKEVLDAAKAQFPTEANYIVRQLSLLITAGRLTEPLSGDLLFTLFRSLGLRVRLDTKIVYEEHGKVKSLAEKIREGQQTS